MYLNSKNPNSSIFLAINFISTHDLQHATFKKILKKYPAWLTQYTLTTVTNAVFTTCVCFPEPTSVASGFPCCRIFSVHLAVVERKPRERGRSQRPHDLFRRGQFHSWIGTWFINYSNERERHVYTLHTTRYTYLHNYRVSCFRLTLVTRLCDCRLCSQHTDNGRPRMNVQELNCWRLRNRRNGMRYDTDDVERVHYFVSDVFV